MIVTSIDATGIELSSRVLLAGSNGNDGNFVEIASVQSAGVPHRIGVGQLDADGIPDFVWDDTSRRPLIQVAYAQSGPDGPLSALLQSLVAGVFDVVIGDVTGDGLDDVGDPVEDRRHNHPGAGDPEHRLDLPGFADRDVPDAVSVTAVWPV